MKPQNLPAPLTVQEFYTLFALFNGEGHGYNLRSRRIAGGTLYPLLSRLHDQGYIDIVGNKPAGKSGIARRHYGISGLGIIRLKEELVRLKHAVKIAENAGLLEDEMPLDIQRLILEAA